MQSTASTTVPVRRLGVGHFLVWMLGCGVVLAIYRAGTDLSQVPEEVRWRWQVIQLGYALAYGTAFSGLGLFLWWRWSGTGIGPTQPGHWLLVFGGLGMLLDLGIYAGTSWVSEWLLAYSLSSFLMHQVLGWTAATLVAVIALTHLQRNPRWRRVALIVAGILLVYAITYVLWLIAPLINVRGIWPAWTAIFARVAGHIIGVPAVVLADIADRREGRPRDWLHTVGIAAIAALVAVDFAVNVPVLIQNR